MPANYEETSYAQATVRPRVLTSVSGVIGSGLHFEDHVIYNSGVSGGIGRTLKLETEMGSTILGGISPSLTPEAAKSYLDSTEREKREMQSLNNRLQGYIAKVKQLEQQNAQLVEQLADIRGRWGKGTKDVKDKYSGDLAKARKDLAEEVRDNWRIQIEVDSHRQNLKNHTDRLDEINGRRANDLDKIARINNEIANAQSELEMLRARWAQLQEEESRLNRENARLWKDLLQARVDHTDERLSALDSSLRLQELQEEREFLLRVHEQEVKELQALLAQVPADTRDFFKNELALAIRDIKQEYEYIAEQGRQDMESWYKLKVSEVQNDANQTNFETVHIDREVQRVRTGINESQSNILDQENKKARLTKDVNELQFRHNDDKRQFESALRDRENELQRLREEVKNLSVELQSIYETKKILDTEIAIYRTLVQGEELRVGSGGGVGIGGGATVVGNSSGTGIGGGASIKESQTKTTFRRTTRGNIAISECDANGRYIALQNTHNTKDENVSNGKITRNIDGRREIVYTIPSNIVLPPGGTIRIFAQGQGISNPPESLVNAAEYTWGVGDNITTRFINRDGEERALHEQHTVQI